MFTVSVICVGRLKASAERDLESRYLDRAKLAGRTAGVSFEVHELDESRARRAADRKAAEAAAVLAMLPPGAVVVAMDERGQTIGSRSFAEMLGAVRDEGSPALALVIGGPDGLDPALRNIARRTISFGAMTWPHQLVRVMLGEQLYRAVTILTGHPYHRD